MNNQEIRDAAVQFTAVLLTQHLLQDVDKPNTISNMALEQAESLFELLDKHYPSEGGE